jgi:hypothetical protein
MEKRTVDLGQLMRTRSWRNDHGSAVFATDSSWAWFKRTHRARLISEGALIVRRGRAGDLVNIDLIGGVVASILMEQSTSSSVALPEFEPVSQPSTRPIGDKDAAEVSPTPAHVSAIDGPA